MRSLQDEIGAGAVSPAPRERSTFQEYGPRLGITLLIPVLDLRHLVYVSVDDMMADAWVSKDPVELKLPAAIATARNKRAAGIPLVTRERTTYSKYTWYHHHPAIAVTVNAFQFFQTLYCRTI